MGVSVKEISALAKKIRKDGEKWTDAIKRASAQLNGGGGGGSKSSAKPKSKSATPAPKSSRKRFQELID